MIKETIIYNGVRALFRDMKYLYAFGTKCPICLEPIYKDDAIYSIMNNDTLFPNIAVHKSCADSKEKCIKQLISSYTRFKKTIKEYSFWQWNNGRNI